MSTPFEVFSWQTSRHAFPRIVGPPMRRSRRSLHSRSRSRFSAASHPSPSGVGGAGGFPGQPRSTNESTSSGSVRMDGIVRDSRGRAVAPRFLFPPRSYFSLSGTSPMMAPLLREVFAGLGLASPCVLFAAFFSGPGRERAALVVAGLLCAVMCCLSSFMYRKTGLTSKRRGVLLLLLPYHVPTKGHDKRR